MKQAIFFLLLFFGIQNVALASLNIPDANTTIKVEKPRAQKKAKGKRIKAKPFSKQGKGTITLGLVMATVGLIACLSALIFLNATTTLVILLVCGVLLAALGLLFIGLGAKGY